MSKRLLAALLVSTSLGTLASAADLATKAPPRLAPPVYDWTGFYLGVHGGYGWADATPEIDIDPFSNPAPKGWVFGGQAGYLWQSGRFVGGLEIDYSGADLNETQSFDGRIERLRTEPFDATLSLNTKIEALASARARAGFLVMPNWYLYGTGGIAWARSKANVSLCEEECLTTSAVENNFGWVAGAGLEWKLSQNWLLRGEYLHYDFGTTHYNFTSNFLPFDLGVKSGLTTDVVRGAVSFKF